MTPASAAERRLSVVKTSATDGPAFRTPFEPLVGPLLTGLSSALGSELPRRLVIAGARRGAGATTLAAATALALARDLGRRVLLVEANLARPHLAAVLGMPPAPGLSEVVRGEASEREALRELGAVPGLVVLPAGGARRGGAAELMSETATRLFDGEALQLDHVVVDLPPLIESAAGPLLLRRGDTVALVAASGRSQRDDVERAIGIIERAGARLAGVLLNRCDRRTLR